MNDSEHPLEPFKRATTATIRAIAEDEGLEVTFGQGPAVMRGNKLRVPLPNLGATAEEIDAIRGMGDAFALKLLTTFLISGVGFTAVEVGAYSKTTLVIAHRLSTVSGADRIIVLEGGQLREEGTHEALMALGGAYSHLYHMGLRSTELAKAQHEQALS